MTYHNSKWQTTFKIQSKLLIQFEASHLQINTKKKLKKEKQ